MHNTRSKATWGGRDINVAESRVTRKQLRPNPDCIESECYQLPSSDDRLYYLVAIRLDERIYQTRDRRMAEPVITGIYASANGARALERDYVATRDRSKPVTDQTAWETAEHEPLYHAVAAPDDAAGDVPDERQREFRDVLRECHALPAGEVTQG